MYDTMCLQLICTYFLKGLVITIFDEQLQQLGQQLYNSVELILEEKSISKGQLAERLNRSQPSLNKLLHDLKLGKLTLKSLLIVANAIEVDINYIFEKKYNKQEVNYFMWKTRIQNVISTYPIGAMIELNQILAAYWTPLTNTEKQQLGKWFYSEVLAGNYPNIMFHHKNSANHAYYEII